MLKRIAGVVSILAFTVVSAHADPKDDIKTALQTLADSPSYSWTSTTQGGFGRGPQDGKTEKDGYTSLTMQMRDSSFDVVIKGDKAAVKTDSGWKTAAEILAEPVDTGGPPPPEWRAAMFAQNFKTPVAQAMDNLDTLQNIQKTDDGYTADLTADGAKKLLSFGRRRLNNITVPGRASASADRHHRPQRVVQAHHQGRQHHPDGTPPYRIDQLQRRRSPRCGPHDDDSI